MADPFVAEIRIFPFNFAPKGWAWCDGQLLPISQNTALFSLLGTNFGGDGKSTFALPNLQGSVPMHTDDNEYPIGAQGGSETVTLLQSEMPFHNHNVNVASDPGETPVPSPDVILTRANGGNTYNNAPQSLVPMAPQTLAPSGGSLPHNNMQPYLTMNFCIALQGVFPQRP